MRTDHLRKDLATSGLRLQKRDNTAIQFATTEKHKIVGTGEFIFVFPFFATSVIDEYAL